MMLKDLQYGVYCAISVKSDKMSEDCSLYADIFWFRVSLLHDVFKKPV